MNLFRKLLPILLIVIGFSSCKLLRPNFMLKTPKNYKFDAISDSLTRENYRLTPTDAVEFRVFANEGFKLVCHHKYRR